MSPPPTPWYGGHPPYTEAELSTAREVYGSGGSLFDVAYALKCSVVKARQVVIVSGLEIRPRGGRPGQHRRPPRNTPKPKKAPSPPGFSKTYVKLTLEESTAQLKAMDAKRLALEQARIQLGRAGLLRPLPPEDDREPWEWELAEAACLDGLVPCAERLRAHALYQAGRVY